MSKKTRQKQRIWLIIAFIVIGYAASYLPEQSTSPPPSSNTIEQSFKQQKSNVQLETTGKVVQLLPDDLEGSRHQKFLIKIAEGHTILVAHNIDLASRIDTLQIGDNITIYGEYEWNEKGGVIHWTHHDPAKRHADGWIKHLGKIYQ